MPKAVRRKGETPKMTALRLEPTEVKSFRAFEANVRRYSAKRDKYMSEYRGRYVAVLNGRVIDNSEELSKLLERLRRKHNLAQVLIDHLSEKTLILHSDQ